MPNIETISKLIAKRTMNTFHTELANKFNGCLKKWDNKFNPKDTAQFSEEESRFVLGKICVFVVNIVSSLSFILTKKQKKNLLNILTKKLN